MTSDGRALKLPSSREDPARVVAEAVRLLSADGASDVRHGTTVATNAVLEGKLARVGVILNRGFRDLLFIGRQARPDLYALEPARPPLPTTRTLCQEVSGRLGPRGEEWEPFDADACASAGRALLAAGAQALAVVLLHSYANPAHEDAAATALASLGVPVTLSSRLNPEFREVERGLCALFDAGLRPPVGRYLAHLEEAVAAATRPPGAMPIAAARRPHHLGVMTSEGGTLPASVVAEEPVRLLVSGPAGGIVAAQVYGEALGEPQLLTLDMGGTSTDVAFLDGDLPRAPDLTVAGHRIRLPTLDIHTVGAGGGSLVQVDAGGALRVGPESAGADPGPCAYGRSDRLTVTDAHLLLGRICPAFFAGGEDLLDAAHAERCARELARTLGLPLRRLLEGILRLADLTMARALRVISLERGRDPRGAALLVFGGAGGLHGVTLARSLGMSRVIVPPRAGVLSAQGLLWAAPSRTRARSVLLSAVPGSSERKRLSRPLVEELRAGLVREGHRARDLTTVVTLDLRYRGQSFELEVPECPDPESAFHALHGERFGFTDDSRTIELVTVRVRVTAPVDPPTLPELSTPAKGSAPHRRTEPEPVTTTRTAGTRAAPTPVFDRDRLRPGQRVAGPCLVADSTASVWVDAKARLEVHPTGALVIEVGS